MQVRNAVFHRPAAVGAALMLFALGAAADESPASFAQSPAWEHGQSFVAAFNAGNERVLARYLKRNLSAQAIRDGGVNKRVLELRALRRQLGAVEAVEVSGLPHAAILNLRSQDGDQDADLIVISSGDGTRIDQLRLVTNPPETVLTAGACQ